MKQIKAFLSRTQLGLIKEKGTQIRLERTDLGYPELFIPVTISFEEVKKVKLPKKFGIMK